VPPQAEWSRPPFVYDPNAILHIHPSILLNHFFLPTEYPDDEAGGGFVDSNQPGALTELTSLVTLQADSTICAGSDLPQLPPEGAWGSQPTAEFVDDAPFIPPSASNRSYSPPVAPTTQPEYAATQQTTIQYPNFNIDPRLYQVRTRHSLSSMVDLSSLSSHSPPVTTLVTTAEAQLHQIIATRTAASEATGPTEAPRQALNPARRAIPSTLDISTINFHPIKQHNKFLQSIILRTTVTTNASGWSIREKTR
jgi:hypothetical protein